MKFTRVLAEMLGLILLRHANMLQPVTCNVAGSGCIMRSGVQVERNITMTNDHAKILSEVRRLRRMVLDDSSAQPTPVVALAGKLGFDVDEFEPTEDTDSISGAVAHEEQTIFVNKDELPSRKRFTIAHEIGHIVLHGSEGNYVDYRHQIGPTDTHNTKEREANRFAVELLMPRHIFDPLWSAYSGDIDAIAEHLLVSRQTAEIRAKECGFS